MANNGIYYSSGNSLNFTTNSTTWATLGSGGTFVIDTVSGGTYLNLPVSGITAGTGIGVSNSNGNYTISYTGSTGTSGDYLPLSGGTVTGGTIFTSGVTANTLSNVNYILFNKTATTTHTEGQIHWNDDTKTLEIDTDKTGVTYETGQNTLVRVTNKTGAPLTAGTVVYINGAQGGRPTVTKATYEQDATSARSLGFITVTINDNNQGYVTTNGLLRNVNTNSYTAGTQLYLYTGGTVTNVRPVAPKHEVRLGYVVTQGTVDGVIYVYIQNGYEFTELHDVQISGQTNNDIPYWNSTLGVWKNTNSPVFTSLTATTISAATYLNLPYTGQTNFIPKWTNTTGLTDSQIYDDGTQVNIGGSQILGSLFSVTGTVGINEFQIQATAGSLGITDQDLTSWTTGGGEIAIGGLGPLVNSTGTGNVAIGAQSMISNSTGVDNVAVGRRSLSNNQSGQANVAIGYRAGGDVNSGSYNVFIGYEAGSGHTTQDNRLYIANNNYGTLIYGEFDNQIVNINGTLSATTYDNLPGSSAGNCFTTFYVTNISGCSPVNMLSPLNVQDGLSVTGNSTFTSQVNFTGGISASTFSASTYQNLPVSAVTSGTGISTSTTNGVSTITNTDLGSSQNIFKNIQVDGVTQFSAGSNSSNLNFSGINITITSAATNTLVFSAGTGGVSGNFLPTSGGTITGNLIVTGDTNVSGTTTTTGNVISLQNLQSLYSVGDEGGEITLAKPATNSTISGTSVTIDIYQNRLRFFESGGSNRGAYIDLTQGSPSAGSNLLSGGTGGGVTSVTAGSGLSGSSTTGAITLINTQVQGITGITAGSGISATTTGNVTTISNTQSSATGGTFNLSDGTLTMSGTGTLGTISIPLLRKTDSLETSAFTASAVTTVKYFLIPANTVGAGDIVTLTGRIRKSGSTSSLTARFYASTSTTPGGSVLGAYALSTAASTYLEMTRNCAIVSATNNTHVASTGVNLATGFINTTLSTATVNWTNDVYLLLTYSLGSSGDNVYGVFFDVEIRKYNP